nr:hypothetical protein [Tanacetum cinerariifolium]
PDRRASGQCQPGSCRFLPGWRPAARPSTRCVRITRRENHPTDAPSPRSPWAEDRRDLRHHGVCETDKTRPAGRAALRREAGRL